MVKYEEHEATYIHDGEKKIFYLAAGPKYGPTIVFVHGWPAIAKTWKNQIDTFANLGFRVIAPDMPGYGRTSARKKIEDYSLESINIAMAAVLDHVGQEAAIWIGHDWGCGAVWSFAEHYPERTIAVAGLAVPSHVIEKGLEEELKTVNRDTYPEDQYPYGQWDYQRFYQVNFEKATSWFDSDVAACMRAFYAKGSPASLGKPAFTANVQKDGGWFGGLEKPDPAWKQIPIEATCIDEEIYKDLVEAMERTSFYGADAWYANHETNRKYFFEKAKNDGYLHMPTLFIHARYDTICDTFTSSLAEPGRKYCTNLTEASIEAGHWVAQEKPEEVNQIITRWILESVPKQWPGYWTRGFVKSKV
ncbi:Epoxide hydrolase A [Pseudocercospora fuligena]|uniref:Epoxide hydrolase A n=1 Tax=Pseudocercospora fuligena TaxID=685502 RepID=A0A8H6RTE9_9PEZI|nr:Epoxide hydrolase A [Pseudocercospora fuligena]